MQTTEHFYQETDLGNIAPNPRGDYDSTASYEYLDTVVFGGGSYLCVIPLGTVISNISPETGKTTRYWQVLTLPGSLTPEYIAMHDDVVNKHQSVVASHEVVEELRDEVQAMEANVESLQEQAIQSAQEAESSKDSAAGYAQSADVSRQAAAESEANVTALVNGFDTHVEEKTTEAENAITKARQNAVEVVNAASQPAVTAAGNAATSEANAKTSETNAATSEANAKTSEENAALYEASIKESAEKAAENAQKAEDVMVNVNAIIAGNEAYTKYESDRKYGSGIIQKMAGKSIVAKDSSNNPLHGLKLYGKTEQVQTNGYQLFDASKLATHSAGGVTVTNNGDGSFAVSGSGTSTSAIYKHYNYTHAEMVEILKAGLLTFKTISTTNPYFYISIRNDVESVLMLHNLNNNISSKEVLQEWLDDENLYMRIGYYAENNSTIVAKTIKPMLYIDGDGTWEPFTGGEPSPSVDYPQELESLGAESGQIESSVYGKNLLPYPYVSTTKTSHGITYTDNGNGTITITGTATGDTFFILSNYIDLGDSHIDSMNRDSNSNGIYTISKRMFYNGSSKKLSINIYNGTTVNETLYPQVELGTVATPYEPYKAKQSHIATVSSGLPGLPLGATIPDAIANSPIHMSGVWYDEDEGQYYIGNTVDLETGKYVQRVIKEVFDGSESVGWALQSINEYGIANFYTQTDFNSLMKLQCFYSHGFMQYTTIAVTKDEGCHISSNGTKFFRIKQERASTVEEMVNFLQESNIILMSILATPIETELPAEEIAAYKALHTNYPTTTIMNDCDAHMEVEYVADTKNHITQNYVPLSKYNELEERILALEQNALAQEDYYV